MNQKHKYCGSKNPSDYYVNSDSVAVKFHSDSTIEGEGFQITATYMKGEHFIKLKYFYLFVFLRLL